MPLGTAPIHKGCGGVDREHQLPTDIRNPLLTTYERTIRSRLAPAA
jgi:hypothetical protein